MACWVLKVPSFDASTSDYVETEEGEYYEEDYYNPLDGVDDYAF